MLTDGVIQGEFSQGPGALPGAGWSTPGVMGRASFIPLVVLREAEVFLQLCQSLLSTSGFLLLVRDLGFV